MSQHERRSQSRSWKAFPYLVICYEWYPAFSSHSNAQRPIKIFSRCLLRFVLFCFVLFSISTVKVMHLYTRWLVYILKNFLHAYPTNQMANKIQLQLAIGQARFPALGDDNARLPHVFIGALRSFLMISPYRCFGFGFGFVFMTRKLKLLSHE